MRRALLPTILCAALALSLLACGGADKRPDPVPKASAIDSPSLLSAYAHLMPKELSVFIRVDMRALSQEHLPTAFGMLGREWDHAAMTRDLSRLSEQRLGVDLTRASWCVLAASKQEGVILCDQGAALETYLGEQALNDNITLLTTVDDRDFQAKLYGFKQEGVVGFSLDALSGGEDILASLAKGPAPAPDKARLAYLSRLLRRVGDADLTVAVHPDQLPLAQAFDGAPAEAGVAFSVGERVTVALQGDKAMLEDKILFLNKFLDEFRDGLGQQLKEPGGMSAFEALGATWAWHTLGPLSQQLKPAQEGDLLVYDLSTQTLVHPVTVLGVVGFGVYYFFFQALGAGLNDAFEVPMQGLDPDAPVEAPQE